MLLGLGPHQPPHEYKARVALTDIDMFGHMNNAAYLSHAEFARWEMMAANGCLKISFQRGVTFLLVGSTIRFRKEIRPLFSPFQVDTNVVGIDERSIWIMHKFRGNGSDRIAAQLLVEAVLVEGRTVIDPAVFFTQVGLDGDVMEKLKIDRSFSDVDGTELNQDQVILQRYDELQGEMRKAAAIDDEQQTL